MNYAHIVRYEGVNHAVLINRPSIKLNGRHHTICALRVTDQFQHRPGNYPHAYMTCDSCIRSLTGWADLSEGMQ